MATEKQNGINWYRYVPRKKTPAPKHSRAEELRSRGAHIVVDEAETKAKELKRLKDDYMWHLTRMFEPGSMERYVVLDTETTGVDDDARIIDIAIVSMTGEVLFSALLDPGVRLSEKVAELTGITDEMLAGKWTFNFVAPGLSTLLEGKKVVCWNVSFDKARLYHEFGLTSYRVNCDWVCAMHLYHILKMDRKGRWPKLQAAMEAEGIQKTQTHRALGDCQDTLAVLQKLHGTLPLQYSLFDEATEGRA